jgi:hypothetical protein
MKYVRIIPYTIYLWFIGYEVLQLSAEDTNFFDMVFFIEKQHLTKIKRIELNVVANARLYICNLLFIEPSKKKKTTKSCRFCKVNIKVLSIKYKQSINF